MLNRRDRYIVKQRYNSTSLSFSKQNRDKNCVACAINIIIIIIIDT